jgi:hypothetical protein
VGDAPAGSASAAGQAADAACVLDASSSRGGPGLQQQQLLCAREPGKPSGSSSSSSSSSSSVPCCSSTWGHEPVRMLFKHHWREVLVLFWFEAWSAANFYGEWRGQRTCCWR